MEVRILDRTFQIFKNQFDSLESQTICKVTDHLRPTSRPGESTRTDYRRPLHTFEQTITAALSLYVFKTTL